MKRKFGNDVKNRVSRVQVAPVCRKEPSEDRATALESRNKSRNRNEENDEVSNMGLLNFAIRFFWEQKPVSRHCSGGCGCWKSLSPPDMLTPFTLNECIDSRNPLLAWGRHVSWKNLGDLRAHFAAGVY
jgi:hypothetical protein